MRAHHNRLRRAFPAPSGQSRAAPPSAQSRAAPAGSSRGPAALPSSSTWLTREPAHRAEGAVGGARARRGCSRLRRACRDGSTPGRLSGQAAGTHGTAFGSESPSVCVRGSRWLRVAALFRPRSTDTPLLRHPNAALGFGSSAPAAPRASSAHHTRTPMGAVRCLLAIGLLAVCRGAKEDERDCEGAPRSPRCRALRRQSPPGCQSTRYRPGSHRLQPDSDSAHLHLSAARQCSSRTARSRRAADHLPRSWRRALSPAQLL